MGGHYMVHLKSKKQRVDADEVFTLAQSIIFILLHLHFIFVAFSLYLAGHVPINRATQIL